ncbi:hypothetical protein V8C34DRAFT_283207 [Trichoderma compactum]
MALCARQVPFSPLRPFLFLCNLATSVAFGAIFRYTFFALPGGKKKTLACNVESVQSIPLRLASFRSGKPGLEASSNAGGWVAVYGVLCPCLSIV